MEVIVIEDKNELFDSFDYLELVFGCIKIAEHYYKKPLYESKEERVARKGKFDEDMLKFRQDEYSDYINHISKFNLSNLKGYLENFDNFKKHKYSSIPQFSRKTLMMKDFLLYTKTYIQSKSVVAHFKEKKINNDLLVADKKADIIVRDKKTDEDFDTVYRGRSWIEFIKFIGNYEDLREQQEVEKWDKEHGYTL